MIKILTLFLGLYTGAQTVDLEVAGALEDRVAEIELSLDGETVATLSEPPWRMRVDLGKELVPRELIAVARDGEGVELARDRRWINLEVGMPADDATVRDDDPARNVATPVAVRLDPGTSLPAPDAMRGWFAIDGQPLEVLRVERGDAEVVIVRDPNVQPYLDRTAKFFFQFELEWTQDWDHDTLSDRQAFVAVTERALLDRGESRLAQRVGPAWARWNGTFSFGDAGVRFISPRAAPVSRVARPHGIFNVATERRSNEFGLLWHSSAVRPLYFSPRLADAVAMAGLEAHAGARRRAVVLMLEEEPEAADRYSPAAVRAYLEAVQVPLFVWQFRVDEHDSDDSAESEAAVAWQPLRDLSHRQKLDPDDVSAWLDRVATAVADVREELDRQRVVWLAGSHAPHRVELSLEAVGVRLAGSTAPVSIPLPEADVKEARR